MTTWACAACGGENPEGTRFCGHCGAPAAQAAGAGPPATEHTERDLAAQLRSFVAGQVADRLEQAGGRLTEERRLVTALFADISGFTRLADALDPEQLLEVIDPVVSALSRVVGRYGGYVDKFAGDALLALFGAPVSHEDDAERALLVALEMQHDLERLRRELPGAQELTLHVGVNSGHGIARIIGSEVRMDYAVLGDSVILAQRLEAAAPAGETYVGETTYRLTQDRFDLERVGELTLKGKSEPVPAWRLVGERRGAGRRMGEQSRLVGRVAELAAVASILERLEEGRGTSLTVIGEPGVGKSRLTAELRRLAEARGVLWLEGRCLSYGGGLPYWPYLELLRGFAGIAIDERPERAAERLRMALEPTGLGHRAPLFAHLLGLPGAYDGSLDPEGLRHLLHELVAALIRALAAGAPVAVVLEDVHWLDPSSLELTKELARVAAAEPVLLYLTGRPEARPLAEATGGTSLVLEPLGPGDLEKLVEVFLQGRPPPGIASALAERSGGNPFFVEELLRSLLDGNALERVNGSWRLRGGGDVESLPATIEGVLSARIDLLPHTAAAVLQSASVVGRRVRLRLLRAIEPGAEAAALDQLVESAFLDRAPEEAEETLIFHHALVQEVAYARLLRRRRADLHRRVADAAEALYGGGDDVIELLARHLYLGEAGPKALDYVLRAADRSRRLFANSEAILQLGWALEVAEAHPELQARRAGILLDLAELRELVGEYELAHALFVEVRDETGDVRAWRGLASTLRKQGAYGEAIAVADEALRSPGLASDLRPLWLERASTLIVSGNMREAIGVARAGLAAGGGHDVLAGELLLKLAEATAIEGRLEEAVAHALEAQRVFEQAENLPRLATALRVLGDTYRELGRLDEAAAMLRRGLTLAERVGSVEELAGCLINLAIVEMRRGALDEAIAVDRRAIEEFERIGHGSGRVTGYANLAEMHMLRGDDEALETAARALELAREIGHSFTIPDILATTAMIHLRGGDAAAAAVQAEEAVRGFLEIGALGRAAESLELAAEAWEQAGDEERACASRDRARSLA